ncbi:hypothetical protein P154DRAFT_539000 [Amniculicola lignicola CBS 123094]|uniref:NTF2 domain-containing protein n=1 Tax=Amniculicola lignicola CBS 123094 TaxID=1392246 RepID=A0A6A5VZT0_9PLEO|nr:hypothetical protein P154DRAFT_539000 [Amniculicola lignicola CBS 123094]
MGDATMTPEDSLALSLDTTACNVAEAFTDAYYNALSKYRSTLSSFYCPKVISTDSTVPSIYWNGEVYDDDLAFQSYIESLTYTWADIESLDCTVLNTRFLPAAELKGGSGDNDQDLERRMQIAVVVTGSLRLEEPAKGPMREFAETFVLIPNKDKQISAHPQFKNGWDREWLIQTQNFRFTEWGVSELGEGQGEAMKVDGGVKNAFQGRGARGGPARHFAAAGLFFKGKGKA